MEKHYVEIIRISMDYVCGFNDAGFTEYVHEDGMVEKDDLRLCIELSGDHKFLLTGKQRFYITDGYLIVEDLAELK